MPNCLDIKTYDCLDGDHLNRGLFLQSIIKANLSLGALDKAALALVELRKIFRDQAKIFETLSPYFPIGNTRRFHEHIMRKIVYNLSLFRELYFVSSCHVIEAI